MYYCFVYPYLQYCNEVWGNAYPTHLKRLTLLQKRVIRIIAKVDKFYPTDELFVRFKILKFHNINNYMIGQVMYKAFWVLLPKPVQNMFIKNAQIHSHNTRQSNDFHFPKPKTNLLKKSIAFKGVHIWNSIRQNISINCTYDRYKKRLKNVYLNMT